MALERQVVSIPFAGGLDTKTDEKLIAAGDLSDVSDGIYTKAKTIQKRNGYTALSKSIITGGAIAQANKLGTLDDELLLLNDSNLYSYSENSNKWINKGRISNISSDHSLIADTNENGTGDLMPDVAINANIKVIAWVRNNQTIYGSIIDQTNNAQYVSNFLIAVSTAVNPSLRVISIGTFIYVFWTGADGVHYSKVNTTSPASFGADTLLIALATIETTFRANLDVIPYTVNKAILTYYDTGAGHIYVTTIDQNAAILLTTNFAQDAVTAITLCFDASNSNIYVTYNSASVIRYRIFSSALAVVLVDTLIFAMPIPGQTFCMSTIVDTPNVMRIFWNYVVRYTPHGVNMDFNHVNMTTATVLGVVAISVFILGDVVVVTKPFVYNGETYVLTRKNSSLQGTFYLLNKLGDIVGKSVVDQASPIVNDRAASIVSPSNGHFVMTREIIVKVLHGIITFIIGNVTEIDFNLAGTETQSSTEINGILIIANSAPQLYDSTFVTEYGFNEFCERVDSYPFAAGGSMADGTYSYYIVYEWIDAKGNIHQSAPSTGTTVVVAGGGGAGHVELDIATLAITNKNNAYIVIYRTLVNQITPHRLPFTLFAGSSNPILNNRFGDVIGFTDIFNDTDIASGQILYTTGGVVDNIVPPGFKQVEIFKNRLLIAGLEDNKSFWFSKTIVPGDGPAFNDAFFITVNERGGKVNAVRSMDSNIIIFKNDLIFAVSGDGPLDTGEQDTFTEPQLISSDTGCSNPQSIVLIPTGLMFQSPKGIYHLDRSLRLTYIGAPVEAYNSETVTAATLLESLNQVRFLTSTGRTLLYDYYFSKWNTFLNHTGFDAAISQNVYNYLRTNGEVYKESTSTFTDNGTAITLKPTTPWIKLNSIEGFQRVHRIAFLGNYFSQHVLTLRVYYDYNNNVFDTYTFDTATALIGPDNVYQFRMHLKRQKCESIKIEFDDAVTATPGQGYSINDLTVEIGVKRGIDKLPAIKSVG